MGIVNYKKIVENYSEKTFERTKVELQTYLNYYYIDAKDISRDVFIEKIGEFFYQVEKEGNLYDSEILPNYFNALYNLLDKCVYKSSKFEKTYQAEKYLNRAREIKLEAGIVGEEVLITQLGDFTKIFLCIYYTYLQNSKEKVKQFSFHIRNIQFSKIVEALCEKKKTRLFGKSKEINLEKEPIYNLINRNTENQLYTNNNTIIFILYLIYYCLADGEGIWEE